jgi:hypothetical protein
VGERDRPDLSPYRAVADVAREPERPPRYVPLSQTQVQVRRWVRRLPVAGFFALALVVERPWLVGVSVAWGIGILIVDRLHARSLNARLQALARTLRRGGDPFVAARSLEAVVSDARPYPGFHSVALLFLGIARARGGDAEGALDLLNAVHRAGWLEGRRVWLAWLLPWLATIHAARGDLERAESWLAYACSRLRPEHRRYSLVPCEAIIALRRGRPDEAIAKIDGYRAAHPTETSGDVRSQAALLRAFACEQAGRPLPAEDVRALVAARAESAGQGLPLEKWWTEFATFVSKHAPGE